MFTRVCSGFASEGFYGSCLDSVLYQCTATILSLHSHSFLHRSDSEFYYECTARSDLACLDNIDCTFFLLAVVAGALVHVFGVFNGRILITKAE